jgi:2,3-bisphosphoglycerate-independent phosphoglycerate mutase
MKIAILLGDGMAGRPLPDRGNKTTLELASTPNMDRLAREGTLGLASTVPEGYPPGSDVANLSVFGFNPADCYTGRAPIEAAAMGVALGPEDVAYRLNLVTLLAGMRDVYMHDFTAGHITSEEARRIIEALNKDLAEEGIEFYPGVSYRNLFVWRNGEAGAKTTPPHDITGKPIQPHLPTGPGSETLLHLMTGSQLLLKGNPVNAERRERGDKEANSIWLWGQGKPPKLEKYREKFGLTGTVISAVDLIKGIGALAGLRTPAIPGATGFIDTNYEGKVKAALDALRDEDFVFVHVEAPDETGHQGDAEKKIIAIEDFDKKVVGPVWKGLEDSGEQYALLVMPDHPTPIELMTHTSDPVPFALYMTGRKGIHGEGFTEALAGKTGVAVEKAHLLMEHLTGKVSLW